MILGLIFIMSYKIPIPEENKSNKNPSTAKYIGIWFLWSFSYKILASLVAGIYLSNNIITTSRDMNDLMLVISITDVLICTGTFIFIYNLFPELNIKKVMPWLYLGGVLSYFGEYFDLTILKVEISPLVQLYILIAIAVPLYFIRKYYIAKPARWY